MKSFFAFTGRLAMTLVVVAAAAAVGTRLWTYYLDAPWTRDGRVRADIVQVATDVPGMVTQVLVKDDEHVHRGQLLFVLDRPRYELALAQAEAALANQNALLTEAERENQRNQTLSNLVAKEIVEQGVAKIDALKAAVAQATANRDLARLNLERTQVTASVDGWVTNIELRPGDFLPAGRAAMALVDTASLHVDGYFEETKLGRIHVGDKAEVELMGGDHIFTGHVESIAAGIADRERSASGNLLANVNPTFTWVRLAQRIPVRIALDQPTDPALIVGRTAAVSILDKNGKAQGIFP